MNDSDIAFGTIGSNAPTTHQNRLSRFFDTYQRWKKRNAQVPTGSVRTLVAERLREQELFLGEVREQLLDLEASIDELTDTIRSMRGNER